MNKVARSVLVAVFVLTLTTSAMAFGGPGKGYGMGPGNCPNLTPEQAQKVNAFEQEIAPLREKQFKIRAELANLYAQPNPDWRAINAKQKELVDIRTEIQQRAHSAGLPVFKGGRGGACPMGGKGGRPGPGYNRF